jgi:hypothetical protein
MSEEKRERASPHGIFEGSAAPRQSVIGLILPRVWVIKDFIGVQETNNADAGQKFFGEGCFARHGGSATRTVCSRKHSELPNSKVRFGRMPP